MVRKDSMGRDSLAAVFFGLAAKLCAPMLMATPLNAPSVYRAIVFQMGDFIMIERLSIKVQAALGACRK